MAYKAYYTLRELDKEGYTLVQNDTDLAETLESIGLPKKYRKDITGAVLVIGDGDYNAVYLTESASYYDLSAVYHPLPFWDDNTLYKGTLPYYWQASNEYYQK
jgi:hypothetical protein